jgi:signal transduction histidine kinase
LTTGLDGQLLAVLDAQPWGVIVLGRDRVIVSASARAEKLMQRPLLSGLRIDDVLADMIVSTGATDTESLMRGIELELDNVSLWLKAEAVQERSGIEAVISVVDISPLRRSLDERTTSLRFLLHDLRSPLNSIVALTQLEAGDRATFDECGGMDKIAQLARYVLSLGEQFIVSSIATHVANHDFRRFDLRAMMCQIIPQLEVTGVYCGVPLQLWLPDNAAVWVSGVRNFVARAFQNVVDNAIHASPHGESVTVSLKAREGFADIVVTDRAGGLPGLSEPRKVTDFDSLSLAGATGFGIGLKLARQIVELHGGTLYAESIPGEGTSFVLSLPLLAASSARAPRMSLEEADRALRRHADHRE